MHNVIIPLKELTQKQLKINVGIVGWKEILLKNAAMYV